MQPHIRVSTWIVIRIKKKKKTGICLSYVYLLNNMVLIINMLERNLHGLKLTPFEIAV